MLKWIFLNSWVPFCSNTKWAKRVEETNKGRLGHRGTHSHKEGTKPGNTTIKSSRHFSWHTNVAHFFPPSLLQSAPVADIKPDFHTLIQQATETVAGDRPPASRGHLKKKKKKEKFSHIYIQSSPDARLPVRPTASRFWVALTGHRIHIKTKRLFSREGSALREEAHKPYDKLFNVG